MKAIIWVEPLEDDEPDYMLVKDYHGLMEFEVEQVGFDDIMEGMDLEPGRYYELEYESETEDECVDGYVAYSYQVVGEVIARPYPKWKGDLLWKWENLKITVGNWGDWFSRLPRKQWTYCVEYGNVGFSRETYLWTAVWYVIINKDLGFGKAPRRYIRDWKPSSYYW